MKPVGAKGLLGGRTKETAGKGFEFTDQGDVALKGFDEPVRAWAVEWA